VTLFGPHNLAAIHGTKPRGHDRTSAGEAAQGFVRPVTQRWLEEHVRPAQDDAGTLIADHLLERLPGFVSALLGGERQQPQGELLVQIDPRPSKLRGGGIGSLAKDFRRSAHKED
jgi:hypothetical protein